jgi:hypothetical protein
LVRLSHGESIKPEDIARYKILTSIDLQDDDWKFAPILVSTNLERLNITRLQAQRFAKEHKTFVFKWHAHKHGTWINPPSPEHLDYVADNNDFFWDYFVSGAPAFITENINTDLGIANGTPVTCHSLSFETKEECSAIQQLVSDNGDNYGAEIILNMIPQCINVAFDYNIASPRKQLQKKILWPFSLLYNKQPATKKSLIVLPLRHATTRYNENKCFEFRNSPALNANLSKVVILPQFPLELGFAMTIHKAQGRTLPRVILALSVRPTQQIEFAAFYVAMSRVEERNHIRILSHENRDIGQSLYYLTKLHFNPHVSMFYSGFTTQNGSQWNSELALAKYLN